MTLKYTLSITFIYNVYFPILLLYGDTYIPTIYTLLLMLLVTIPITLHLTNNVATNLNVD